MCCIAYDNQSLEEADVAPRLQKVSWLAKQMKQITYTQDMIHSAIRMSKGELGEVSRNVLFSAKSGNVVQRCYVIRKDAFKNAFS